MKQSKPVFDTTKESERGVVGAGFSHADNLRFDDLTLTTGSTMPRREKWFRSQDPTAGAGKVHPRQVSTARETSSGRIATLPGNAASAPVGASELSPGSNEDEFGLPVLSRLRVSETNRSAAARPEISVHAIKYPTFESNSSKYTMSSSSHTFESAIKPQYPKIGAIREDKVLKPRYSDILQDPMIILELLEYPRLPVLDSTKARDNHNARVGRIHKFKQILQAPSISMVELRNLSWSGIPTEVRALAWQVLLGHLSANSDRRIDQLARKRKEYLDGIEKVFGNSEVQQLRRSESGTSRQAIRTLDEAIWHQISIDVPRTSPHIELYSYETTQRCLERILYLWAVRHPASGYVQGINDLVTPLWQVFLAVFVTGPDVETGLDPGNLPKQVLDAIEADTYWCLTKLLEGIQDNYIHAQPGIVRQVNSLKDLTTRVDGALARHLESEGVEFMQFSFRWMNCLLMRELNVKCIIRMWDTYFSEEQGFAEFHLYVCTAFLVKWTGKLLSMDFQDIMMFLQALPTKTWTEAEVELLLSEAYIWQTLFRGSTAHLR